MYFDSVDSGYICFYRYYLGKWFLFCGFVFENVEYLYNYRYYLFWVNLDVSLLFYYNVLRCDYIFLLWNINVLFWDEV